MAIDDKLLFGNATRADLGIAIIETASALSEVRSILRGIAKGQGEQHLTKQFQELDTRITRLDKLWEDLMGWTDDAK